MKCKKCSCEKFAPTIHPTGAACENCGEPLSDKDFDFLCQPNQRDNNVIDPKNPPNIRAAVKPAKDNISIFVCERVKGKEPYQRQLEATKRLLEENKKLKSQAKKAWEIFSFLMSDEWICEECNQEQDPQIESNSCMCKEMQEWNDNYSKTDRAIDSKGAKA